MMSYIFALALIAMTVYYVYSAYKAIKAFIIKKLSKKQNASQISEPVCNISNIEEETHD